jgi:hypothetical protein
MTSVLKLNRLSVLSIVLILFSSLCSKNAWPADGGEGHSKSNAQTFVTYKYIDPMTGMEVFRMLIPKGWKADGDVRMRYKIT